MSEPLYTIYFDGECLLCHKAALFIVRRDPKGIFIFAPLQGNQGRRLPKEILDMDTLVLDEKGHLHVEAKAFFRILWLLEGKYRWLGWLGFLPGWLINWSYRGIAKRRARGACSLKDLPSAVPLVDESEE